MARKRSRAFPKGRVTIKKVEGGYLVNIKGRRFEEAADKRGAKSKVRLIRRLREEDKKRRGR